MPIVLDTNVWVSGVLWRGTPWRIVQLIEDRRVPACVSFALLTELRHVLDYDRLQPRQHAMQQTATDLVMAVMRMTTIVDAPDIEPVIIADPKDDMVLACALAAAAHYIVSGDHHLLDLGQWRGMQIVTANEFLDREFPGEV